MEENKSQNRPKETQDNGAVWAILLTLGMVAVMAILKQFIG